MKYKITYKHHTAMMGHTIMMEKKKPSSTINNLTILHIGTTLPMVANSPYPEISLEKGKSE